MKSTCEYCKGTGRDAIGNPCKFCNEKNETGNFVKRLDDFDLKKGGR